MAKIFTLRRPTDVADLVRSHGLTGLVRPASAHVPHPDGVGERILPVLPELRGLFPAGGLRRGSTVLVGGSTSLLLSLLTSASSAGSWCAVVGMPDLGLVAAAEFGIALGRLALVPDPGPDWPAVGSTPGRCSSRCTGCPHFASSRDGGARRCRSRKRWHALRYRR